VFARTFFEAFAVDQQCAGDVARGIFVVVVVACLFFRGALLVNSIFDFLKKEEENCLSQTCHKMEQPQPFPFAFNSFETAVITV
jgi:hypothetical protein